MVGRGAEVHCMIPTYALLFLRHPVHLNLISNPDKAFPNWWCTQKTLINDPFLQAELDMAGRGDDEVNIIMIVRSWYQFHGLVGIITGRFWYNRGLGVRQILWEGVSGGVNPLWHRGVPPTNNKYWQPSLNSKYGTLLPKLCIPSPFLWEKKCKQNLILWRLGRRVVRSFEGKGRGHLEVLILMTQRCTQLRRQHLIFFWENGGQEIFQGGKMQNVHLLSWKCP